MTWAQALIGLGLLAGGLVLGVVLMAVMQLANGDSVCRRCGEGCMFCDLRRT